MQLKYEELNKLILNFILMNAALPSRFSHVQLCATPETAAHQAPPSLGFSRQEHWSTVHYSALTLIVQRAEF